MKKILFVSGLILVILTASFKESFAVCFSPALISIEFSSKAYWDGPSKSCLPRDNGCCFHISFGGSDSPVSPGKIIGSLDIRPKNEIVFTFSIKAGILPGTSKEFLKGGYFILDGEGTFSEEILAKLGLPASFRLSPGRYPYTENGDVVTVIFK
ncbi:MAG: hypothetical protein NTW10_02855 [Bacteroidetes bacterium]|nr:hypothetical protein [Bacteroidota bacterium]